MRTILILILGGALVAVGGLGLLGAVELARGGGGTEAIAQAFLVPVTLFIFGGAAIAYAIRSRRPGG